MSESEEVVASIPPKTNEISNMSEVPSPSSNDSELTLPLTNAPMQNQERTDHGPGIYAVPYHPHMGTVVGFPSNDLIPLTYNIPRRTSTVEGAGEQQDEQARDQQGLQRQVVLRRFQFAIHLDLFLILKLLAVVVLFNQDGSRQRLFTLLCFAMVVYLHQTGSLAPLIRWLRQQAVPPQPRPEPHRHVRRVDGHPVGHYYGNAPHPGVPGSVNQNQHAENGGMPAENDNEAAEEAQRGRWWGIAQEIKMFVVGFITSLLPGFHQHND